MSFELYFQYYLPVIIGLHKNNGVKENLGQEHGFYQKEKMSDKKL